MSTPTERRYRREARYSTQLRVTVEPATAAALEAEADAAGLSVSAVIRDAVARGLPLVKDARRKRRRPQTEPLDVITWSELKRAAQQAGWKRNGRTWRGGITAARRPSTAAAGLSLFLVICAW